MPEADFTTTDEVYFAGAKVDEVYMGLVKLWPNLPAAPINGTIDLDIPAFQVNLQQVLNEFYIANPIQVTLPHTVEHVSVDVPSGIATGVDFADLLISSASDSVGFYGHNKSQDSFTQGGSYAGGLAMQSRYGGDWVLPPGANVGDKFYVNIGGYGGFYTMAVVTLT